MMHVRLLLILLAVFETIVTGYAQDDQTTPTFNYFNIFTKAPLTSKATVEITPVSVTTERIDHSVILTDFHTNILPDRSVCGLEKEANRIIGGTVAEIDEFPWTAALEYQSKLPPFDNVGVKCGGTLINNRYVLTAAHCTILIEFELVAVRLGEWNTTSDPDCPDLGTVTEPCADPVKKVGIKEVIAHPFYSKQKRNNDIALLRLDEDIIYTNYIRPICLPPLNLPAPAFGTRMTVTGWGTTEDEKLSDIKLKLEIPLLKNDDCNRKLKGGEAVSPNQLCAGGEENKDSCQGDSGGPLMRIYADRINEQPQWYLEGVVSWGAGCARKGIPAVYSRVNRYISWIVNELLDKP